MIYARDLSKELSKFDNKVIMLMPGECINFKRRSLIKFYKFQESFPVYKITNSQPVSFSGVDIPEKFIEKKPNNNYKDFLNKNKIDIIHVHSLMGLPVELLLEAKKLGIKTVFTTHDYFGLCSKIHFYKYDNSRCEDYKNGEECVTCNYGVQSKNILRKRNLLIKVPILHSILKKIYAHLKKDKMHENQIIQLEKIKINKNNAKGYVSFRQYYKEMIENFDLILFNSEITKSEYNKYINLRQIKHIVLPVSHSNIKDNRQTIKYKATNNNKVIFLYMGSLSTMKGFWALVNVLNKIKSKYKNWEINIYGDYSNIDLKNFDNKFFNFFGKYSYKDLPYIFSNSSILIIPSKCKETFGFIGLEAYSYGIPTLVADHVGFSSIIKNDITGMKYGDTPDDIFLEQKLIQLLEKPELLEMYNKNILKEKFEYNSEDHITQIIKTYQNLLKS